MNVLTLIKAMRSAGCDDATILRAIEAAEMERVAERRTYEREKKRRQRAEKAQPVPAVPGDNGDTSPPPPEDKKVPDPKKTHTPSTPPKNPPTGVKKGSRLPDDWRPTEADLAWAEGAYPGRDFEHETEKFRDHWRAASGQNAVKRDWSAAWKNWIRKAGDSGWMKVRDGPGLDQQRARRVFL